MVFLGHIYEQWILPWGKQYNHLPLIELTVASLDKTILYCLIFIGCRLVYILIRRRKINIIPELKLLMFVFYIGLLVSLTVLRHIYYPWQLALHFQRPLSQINLTPFVETFKLRQAPAQLDYWYNFYGNIIWFIPFGLLRRSLTQRKGDWCITIIEGAGLSLCIESAQFILGTGMADIDDLIFNTLGVIIGVLLYQCLHFSRRRR
ncbi:VanZ family protein [Latilactobacillus graminis]|uniref:VanZ like family protein n=2 Tax=Latilactobacillus graminis TaxID=60519 RepID=A0AA89I2E5_9LACO|nr:VanZ family protein [Latilactobacillus graminis]KRM22428.1 vanZ like family protein [Latilactobacillus graminis DSM 20719]QFP79402.1 VanZ family protein [Latilactobacillus graminis]